MLKYLDPTLAQKTYEVCRLRLREGFFSLHDRFQDTDSFCVAGANPNFVENVKPELRADWLQTGANEFLEDPSSEDSPREKFKLEGVWRTALFRVKNSFTVFRATAAACFTLALQAQKFYHLEGRFDDCGLVDTKEVYKRTKGLPKRVQKEMKRSEFCMNPRNTYFYSSTKISAKTTKQIKIVRTTRRGANCFNAKRALCADMTK